MTKVVGASRDLGHIVLDSNSNTVCPGPEDAAGKVEEGDVLCEWDGGYETLEDGTVVPRLSLLNTAPGDPSKPASTCGAFLGAGSGAEVGAGSIQGGAHGAVSADGSVVFFGAPQHGSVDEAGAVLSGPGCWNEAEEEKGKPPVHAPQLYARVRETEPSGEVVHDTLKVSAPEAGVEEGSRTPREYPAEYVGAAEDGSKVFFLTKTELTAEAAALHLHDRELYECEITSETVDEQVVPRCTLTRISAGAPGYQAALGTGTLSAPSAAGSGTLKAGSTQVTAVAASTGTFTVGQEISPINSLEGLAGIPSGTTIVAVGSGTLTGTLTLSQAATVSGKVSLNAGSGEVTEVDTTVGAFAVGRQIEGAGIQAGTTITAVGSGTLTLSAPATQAHSAVELRANDASVDWVPAVSADGSAVYFSAFNVLAPGAEPDPPVSNKGVEGQVNVYRYDTSSGATSFIARADVKDHGTGQPECDDEISGEGTGPCTGAGWYATPNGRFLLFGDSLPNAGYNSGPRTSCAENLPVSEAEHDGRCSELYRYDAQAGEHGEQPLVCVSCGSGNADYEGNAEFARSFTHERAAGPPVGISEDGSYVFFDSAARLVSQVENKTLHVYEWHQDPATHARTVSLISAPNDTFPSYFLGYSPYRLPNGRTVEGANVFFGTHASLVPQDTNTVGNIYDARICEPESPCIKPPTGETATCLGGSCQTPPAAPPDPVATLLAPPAQEGHEQDGEM